MSRELKFRVWWKDESEPTVYSEYDFFDDTWTTAEYIAIEQYTGLKDKNGKGIYEGDIIQTDRGARAIGWNNEYAGFGINETREGFYCFCKLSNFEVIGNIHENPELLENKE